MAFESSIFTSFYILPQCVEKSCVLCVGGSMPSQWGKMKWHTPTPDMIGGNCILMSRRPIPTLYLVFPWSTSGVKNASMCFHYTCIYTSKHSSQQQSAGVYCRCYTFAVKWHHVKTRRPLCPGHSRLFSLVALNLEGEIMFVKCHSVRFGSRADVLSGRYGPRPVCLKWSTVLVFPGGLGTVEWL